MEEFGRRLVVEPFSETAIVAGTLIAKLGTAAQRSDLLPPIMAGDAIWALAHEEGYANGADDVRPVAILEGEGYRIDGAKDVVAAAGWADRLLVSARIGAAGDGAPPLFMLAIPVVRYVWTACVSSCRSRLAPYPLKQKLN